jgi:hypothetical protein
MKKSSLLPLMITVLACIAIAVPAETGFTTNNSWASWSPGYGDDWIQQYPDIAAGSNGQFLCCWLQYHKTADAGQVFASRIAADGRVLDTNGILITNYMGGYFSSVTALAGAGVVAVGDRFWVVFPYNGLIADVCCMPVQTDGTTGSVFRVGTGYGLATVERVKAVSISTQAVLVAWTYGLSGIQYSLVDPVTRSLIVDSAKVPKSYSTMKRPDFAIAGSSNGFLIVWWTSVTGPGSVDAARIDIHGNLVWTNSIDVTPYRIDWQTPGIDVIAYSNGWLVAYDASYYGGNNLGSVVKGRYIDQNGSVSTNLFTINVPWPSNENSRSFISLQSANRGYQLGWSGENSLASPKNWAGILNLDADFTLLSTDIVDAGIVGAQMALFRNSFHTSLAVWQSRSSDHLVGGMYVDRCRISGFGLMNGSANIVAQVRGGTSNLVEFSGELVSTNFQPVNGSSMMADNPSWAVFTNVPANSGRGFYRVRSAPIGSP